MLFHFMLLSIDFIRQLNGFRKEEEKSQLRQKLMEKALKSKAEEDVSDYISVCIERICDCMTISV